MFKSIIKNIILLISIFCININANALENNTNMIVTVKMTVKKDSMVNPSNLKLIPYNNKKIPNGIITKIKDAENLQALRHLRPGMPLRFSYLRKKPNVIKNKIIKIIYNKPGLLLESKVQAMQDGNINDIIKVKNLKTKKILTATVIDENTVTIK